MQSILGLSPSGGPWNLTGIATGAQGRLLYIRNNGGVAIVLKNASSNSTSSNQFLLPNNTDYTLQSYAGVTLIYNGTVNSGVWQVYAPATIAGPTGPAGTTGPTGPTGPAGSSGVTSIAGTSNQVIASASTGAVTLSLPQSIATSSTPQFARVGLGQAADASAVLAATGQYFSTMATATTSLDWNGGNVQKITLASGAQTFTFANPKDGARYLLKLKQPASGAAGTVTWPATVAWSTAGAPTLSTVNGKVDIVAFIYDATDAKFYATYSLGF